MTVALKPIDYGLPHAAFRPGQLESIQFINESKKPFVFLEAPTGSGKSAIATGTVPADGDGVVRILTKTRALQAQYQDYNAEALFGVSTYPCALFPLFKADSCAYPDNMYRCPEKDSCEYLQQRARTSIHHRQALSYAYWWAAAWPRQERADILFCDEAHELPRMIMEHDSLNLTRKEISYYKLKPWPKSPIELLWRKKQFSEWMRTNLDRLRDEIEYLRDRAENVRQDQYKSKFLRRARALKDLMWKISNTYEGFRVDPVNYWLSVNDEELCAKPLSPHRSLTRAFMRYTNSPKVVMASATLGSPEMFAKTLGIIPEQYDSRRVASNFGAESMPIYVPEKSPKMSYSSGPAAITLQANLIRSLIKEMPDTWNGLIHTASKSHAKKLEELLNAFFPGRAWVPPQGVGTEQRLAMWKEKLEEVPNLICISYSFHEGIDAEFAQFNIIAKIPFATLDEYGRAQLNVNPHIYKWNAAVLTQQASGRIRRGDPSHYEVSGEPMRKFVAIVDSNVWTLKGYYSSHFLDCLTVI